MLNGLDLFSGIGGITKALDGYVRPLVYCESDRYCQAVLLSHQQQGFLPCAPIWDDVRTLQADYFPNVDIICGGFPCQDISVAGNGKGLGGERSGLFFEIIRLVREIRPRFVFLENVPAISIRGLDRVLLEFTSLGYDSRWTIVSAAELGAPHIRERWFLLSHATGRNSASKRSSKIAISEKGKDSMSIGDSGTVGWTIEPSVGRVADGIQNRLDRLKGLGNAVVPKQARTAFERLMGIDPKSSEEKGWEQIKVASGLVGRCEVG